MTELTVIRLKEGGDSEHFKDMLQTFQDVLTEQLGAWNISFEDLRAFVACFGWTSVEVCINIARYPILFELLTSAFFL